MILYSISFLFSRMSSRPKAHRLIHVFGFLYPVGGLPVVLLPPQPFPHQSLRFPLPFPLLCFPFPYLLSCEVLFLTPWCVCSKALLLRGCVTPKFPEGVALDTAAIARQKIDNGIRSLSELRGLVGVCSDLRVVGVRNYSVHGNGGFATVPK